MAKKKKKALPLLGLLLVLILLIVAYVAYDQYDKKKQKDKEAQKEASAIIVTSMEEDSLTSITIKSSQGEINLVKDDTDEWIEKENPEVPIDVDKVDGIVTALVKLEALKVVAEDVNDLSEYGFDEPKVTISTVDQDGKEQTLKIGEDSPLGDGSYVYLDGQKNVYLVGTEVISSLNQTRNTIVEMASAPSIASNSIRHLLLNGKNGELEIAYDAKNPYNYSSMDNNYVITKGLNGPVLGDTKEITSYFDHYGKISYGACVENECSDLSKYGLDQPATRIEVTYLEDAEKEDSNLLTYSLAIGSYDEEKAVYYVKEDNSNAVYTITKSLVEGLTDYKVLNLVDNYAHLVALVSLDELKVTANGQTHSLTIKRTPSEIEGEEDVSTYYVDGVEANEDRAKGMYNNFLTIERDAMIPEGYTDEDKEPIVVFEFARSKGTNAENVKVEYREYDDSFYTITINGSENFLIDKRKVDTAVKAISEYKED